MNVNTDKPEITWYLQMLSPEELRPKALLPETQLVRLEITAAVVEPLFLPGSG